MHFEIAHNNDIKVDYNIVWLMTHFEIAHNNDIKGRLQHCMTDDSLKNST